VIEALALPTKYVLSQNRTVKMPWFASGHCAAQEGIGLDLISTVGMLSLSTTVVRMY
jgi:hypothetical protein